MDAAHIATPRRLTVPVASRWGAGEMAVLDFGDPDRPVDLVFAHANGFNALTYRSLLAPLAGGLRIWAPDLRGHGLTRLPIETRGRRGWQDHRDDLAALVSTLDHPVVLAGHSMGAVAALLAAAQVPQKVRGLVLLDPVIWSRPAVLAFNLPILRHASSRAPIALNALKRRAVFDSREAALKAYAGRGAFKGWPEAMLADYLADGLVEAADGGLTLACSPAWESSNYASQGHDPWAALKSYRGPIHILKGAVQSTTSLQPHPRGLPHVVVEEVPGGNHFFPMLQPEMTRDALFEATVSP